MKNAIVIRKTPTQSHYSCICTYFCMCRRTAFHTKLSFMLQSACTTRSCFHCVLKTLSPDHRGQKISRDHSWKLPLQFCDIPSRQREQTYGTSVTAGLCWLLGRPAEQGLHRERPWPGQPDSRRAVALRHSAGSGWKRGAGSGLPKRWQVWLSPAGGGSCPGAEER